MFGIYKRFGNIQSCESVFSTANLVSDGATNIAYYIPEETGPKLVFGKISPKEERNEIFKRTFVVFEKEISSEWISFNHDTGIQKSPELSLEELAGRDFTTASLENILEFCMDVIRDKNMFVYGLFTEMSGACEHWQSKNCISNIFKMIENVDIFEKIVKVSGETFLFTNLNRSDFQLSEGKKLKKVMGIPEDVRLFIKSNKMDGKFPKFQKLCENPNDGLELIAYLKTVKKIFKGKNYDMDRFINAFYDLVISTDVPQRQLLAHLIRENYFFNTAGFPTTEAIELKDCFLMAGAAGIPMDPAPQNLTKYHRILAKNVDILSNPREEEFKEAVSMYSRLEKEMPDEGYVFSVPKDERALVEEGNILHHCVASYRDKIIDEKAIVLFCRRITEPNVPMWTIELDYNVGDTSFNVVQFKKLYDADVTEPEALKLLNKYLDSKRYIIEGGSNLFRKPRVFKAKKEKEEVV